MLKDFINNFGMVILMKILYFTNIPAPYRVDFFNQLNIHNNVTVLFNYDKKETSRNKKWFNDNNYLFKYIYLKRFGLFQLSKIINDGKFDVVIIGTYACLNGALLNILLRMKHIKFFINADGGFVAKNESIISKSLKRIFLSTASYYLSTGKETNKYLTYYGANPNNIYIYPFTSLNKSDVLEKPINYGTKMILRKQAGYNYKRLFICVGSFIDRKGFDILLDILKANKYNDTAFLIIGGGVKKSEYQRIIINNKLGNVFLIDFCSKKEILNYYKMSDVFISFSREDIWGLVINEAMSCGLPALSSDTTLAAKELLEKDKLFKYTDLNRINKKIVEYINKSNSDLYKEGLNNLNIIKDYTIENTVKRHEEIFEIVLNK